MQCEMRYSYPIEPRAKTGNGHVPLLHSEGVKHSISPRAWQPLLEPFILLGPA
jgi:hypothetical protein